MLKHGLDAGTVSRLNKSRRGSGERGGDESSNVTLASSAQAQIEADLSIEKNVINDIASQAFAHLTKARELSSVGLSKAAIPALFPSLGAAKFLKQLQHDDFSISTEEYQQNSHYYFLQLQIGMLMLLLRKKL